MRRLGCAVVLLSSLALAGAPATMADLSALASQQAWAELLERAEDVPAASRTDAWRGLVTSAAAGVVETADSGRATALAARYKFLSTAPGFIAAREKVAEQELGRCLDDTEGRECLQVWKKAVPSSSPDANLRAAKRLNRGYHPYVAMPLFAAAVTGKDAAACRDDELASTTLAALGLPASDTRVADAKRVAFELCFTALQPKLKAAMVGASAYLLENCCKPMRAKKALTELQEDLCHDAEQ